MNQSWMFLYGGVVAAGLSMPLAKLANGFENLQYSIPAIFLYVCATVCWLMAMKQLPLSTAWLIWLGMDAVIMLCVSYFMFGESFSLGKVLCMLLIMAGCVGLQVLEMKK